MRPVNFITGYYIPKMVNFEGGNGQTYPHASRFTNDLILVKSDDDITYEQKLYESI